MSSEDAPYHCADCGFCRVGGRENYRHCQGCGMCIDVVLFEEHNCSAGKYMSNCPVCYEDLFSSRMLTHVSSYKGLKVLHPNTRSHLFPP